METEYKTEYKMVEGSTENIGTTLTELAKVGWIPFPGHQSTMKSGSYSIHSVLLMRVITE